MNGREVTPRELAIWEAFKTLYRERVTREVKGALAMGELLAAAQRALDKVGIIDPTPWTRKQQAEIDLTLAQYNAIGRLVEGVDARRYVLFFVADSDFHIYGPPTVGPAELPPDVYPVGLGLAPVVVAVTVGTLLIGAAAATVLILQYRAQAQQTAYRRAILEADREMAKQDPAVQAKYTQWKQQNIELIREANKAPQGAGILDRLLGGIGGTGIGALLGIGLVAWILASVGKPAAQRATAQPEAQA
jgi:hypothetical protein